MDSNHSVWNNLRAEIDFLKQYPILIQATADNSSPIPGYLYGEINSVSYINNGCHCKQLVDYLLSKAQCNSPVVKIKVLKLFLYLMKNGHSNIGDILKSNEAVIRELSGANGPPDPLHGKTFYENIRQMAVELLHVMYSEENLSCFPSSSKSVVKSPDDAKISGYGSTASFKKMQGFGNTIQTPRTVGKRVTEGFTYIVDRMLSSTGEDHILEKQKMLLTETLPHYEPIKINKSTMDISFTNVESGIDVTECNQNPSSVPHMVHKEVYQIEKPGGVWDDENDDSFDSMHSDVQDIFHNHHSNHKVVSINSSCSKSETNSKQDWSDEHKIVNEFTVNQPASALDWGKITLTCKTCASLNCDKIIELLISKLNDVAENTKLRALILIEVLLYKDIVPIESLVKIALPHLQNQCQLMSNPCQIKAKKICMIIEQLNSVQTS